VIELTERRDELVHDAAHRSDVGVLGRLSGKSEIDARDPVGVGERRHGQRDRHLERGRRRQARPRGNVAVDQEVGSRELEAVALPERLHGALDVVEPAAPLGRPRMIEIELLSLLEALGDDADPAIASFRRGDDRAAIDRHRQREAVVVIGVLADQVDATRRGEDPRLYAVHGPEDVLDGRYVEHVVST
jgi:hypothetical protein